MPLNIYFDLGSSWANTLRLAQDLFPDRGPWITVAFEASPLVQPYLLQYVQFLNGEVAAPPQNCLPRSGSSQHLEHYAKGLGCVSTPADAMRQCMWMRLDAHLAKLVADHKLNSSALIDKRLETLKNVVSGPSPAKPWYVGVPAAVGVGDGWLTIKGAPRDLIRGGATPGTTREFTHIVATVDIVAWIEQIAKEDDFVFVKMDVEGAEHAIVRKLQERGVHRLIDAVAFELHGSSAAANATRSILNGWNATLIPEARYDGMDRASRNETTLPSHCRLARAPAKPAAVSRTWLQWLYGLG